MKRASAPRGDKEDWSVLLAAIYSLELIHCWVINGLIGLLSIRGTKYIVALTMK